MEVTTTELDKQFLQLAIHLVVSPTPLLKALLALKTGKA